MPKSYSEERDIKTPHGHHGTGYVKRDNFGQETVIANTPGGISTEAGEATRNTPATMTTRPLQRSTGGTGNEALITNLIIQVTHPAPGQEVCGFRGGGGGGEPGSRVGGGTPCAVLRLPAGALPRLRRPRGRCVNWIIRITKGRGKDAWF